VPAQDTELLRENERLRKANHILREERDVLKGCHIFRGSKAVMSEPDQKTIQGIVFPANVVYLTVIIDIFSRQVIGWAIRNRMKQDLAMRALNMAIAIRRPPSGCVHHTDSGSQYCAHDYQRLLRKHGFQVSMSGKDNLRQFRPLSADLLCKSLKAELVWRRNWHTRREAEVALFEYINGFCNPRRKHSALG